MSFYDVELRFTAQENVLNILYMYKYMVPSDTQDDQEEFYKWEWIHNPREGGGGQYKFTVILNIIALHVPVVV